MFPAAALCEKNRLCPFCVGGAIQGLVYAVSVLDSLVHISSLLGASQWFCVGVSWGTSVGGRNILTGLGLGLGSWDINLVWLSGLCAGFLAFNVLSLSLSDSLLLRICLTFVCFSVWIFGPSWLGR